MPWVVSRSRRFRYIVVITKHRLHCIVCFTDSICRTKNLSCSPCHGLEDFPLYHTGEDAASLLACWTALWHPLLLSDANKLPHVERCDYPPDTIQDALLLLPVPCESEMDADLPEAAIQQGAKLIRGLSCRDEILKLALEPFGDEAERIDQHLARDFLAFGFAFLQVQLLTQQMRYASSIDETRIQRTIQDAAQAAIAKDTDGCREKLTSCHDALADGAVTITPWTSICWT